MPPRSLEDLTSLIEKKRSDLVLLQARIDAANTSFLTEWVEDENKVSINQLWLMIQAARQECQFSLYISNDRVKVARSKGQRRVDRDATGKLIVVNDPDVFTEYPYDIEAQRERAKKLEAKIRVMNSVLQKANWIATIEVGDLDVTV
jgi:hypothetical protein